MNKAITMPQLGLTMEEGTISAWAKKAGEKVEKDDVILTVSTDKVDMDVEATEGGVLKEILIGEGETVSVGTVLAYLDIVGIDGSSMSAEGRIDSAQPVKPMKLEPERTSDFVNAPTMATQRHPADEKGSGVVASPRARRRAKELGINIETVKGTGDNGRIVEEDLVSATVRKIPVLNQDSDTRLRRLIADKMVESINTIPAFSLSAEANAENLVKVYESLRKAMGDRDGAKLTYTDLLLRVIGLSLANMPAMNVGWNEGKLQKMSNINLAIAVATDRGVVAPVLRNVNELTLQNLSARRSELTERARQNKLTPADFDSAIGTLSNLGMYRVDHFEGIISPGQTFILAAGQLRSRAWIDTSLSIKPTVILTLSVDHRVVDGAAAASFLQRIVELIEDPSENS